MGQTTDANNTANSADKASRIPLDRWTVERAVKSSSLAPPSRLLIYTLLTRVTNGTLVIPPKFAPSLTTLTKETGLSRSTVAEHLNTLEREGWLDRFRPATKEALSERARTAYRIKVPAAVLAGLTPEPVREPDQSGSWTSPGAGPAQEDLFSASPGAGLVREPDATSPGAGLNPMSFPMSSSPSEKKQQGGAGGKRTRPKPTEHPRFAEWYAAYPLRKERAAAAAAFNRAVAKVDDIEVLFTAVKRYREKDPHVLRGYIKNPATWLNKECWLDEIPDSPPAQPPSGSIGNGSGSQLPPRDADYSDPFRRRKTA